MLNDSVTEGQNLQKQTADNDEDEQNLSLKKRGMYSSVIIENFRLFDRLELSDLGKVNLFFGPNNSGKTSILEAIFTHACGHNFAPFRSQVWLRRQAGAATGMLDMGENLMVIFRDRSSLPYTFSISAKLAGDTSSHMVTSTFYPSSELSDLDPQTFGQFSGGFPLEPQVMPQIPAGQIQTVDQEMTLQPTQVQRVFMGKWETKVDEEDSFIDLVYPPSSVPLASHFKLGTMHDLLSHRHPNAETRVFSHLKRYGILDKFVEEMEEAFPGINEIDMVPYPDGTQGPVYVEMNGQRLPLSVFGDGTRRWFHLLGYMLVNRNAVHCIDEVDSSFHPEAQSHFSRLLIQYAEKFGNQLFLTSHSIEFADAFLEALYGGDGALASSSEDPVRIFTIKRSEDHKGFDIWKLTGKEAYRNRSLYNLELR